MKYDLAFEVPPSADPKWSNFNIVHGVLEQDTYGHGHRGVVVDIGANVGAFTCLAALTADYVRAFEPDPTNFSFLSKNVATNRERLKAKVEMNCKGVGYPTGTRKLYRGDVNCGASSLSNHSDGQPSVDVRIVSIEEALEGLPVVDLLKVDCEGAEWEFFFAASAETFAPVKEIAMELHFHAKGQDGERFRKRLSELGFGKFRTKTANVISAVTLFASRV